ncbi:unnamed protein product [Ilex paraguariensis]|uniref:Uncharacterized protein n=1 Tax=Ilex paraguariensis TaxID=185542 RepID=A0ABC8UKS1_9AQUA
MKASLKFREDQKPLFRAKVPLNIIGFPFQSGIVAGEPKELSLNLSTFFDSGPSFKFAYRPNDTLNPFSLNFKIGIGHFGSPISSPMTMSAEFNFIGNQNPSFFVHFKPQFGDFSIKQSISSNFRKKVETKSNGVVPTEDNSVELVETPAITNGYLSENTVSSGSNIIVLPSDSPASRVVERVFPGMEVSTRTALPLKNRAVVNFRWGVRFQAHEEMVVVGKSERTAGISLKRFPLLVMNKIGIEHVAKDESKESKNVGPSLNPAGNSDVAEACLVMRKQLEAIHAENRMLRKAMDDLRSEIFTAKPGSSGGGIERGKKYREGEREGVENSGGGGGRVDRRSSGDKKTSQLNGFGGKAAEVEAEEELKKALMGGAGA